MPISSVSGVSNDLKGVDGLILLTCNSGRILQMIKQKHDQRWWQDAILAFITVITEIVYAVTNRNFHRWGRGGANLLPPMIYLGWLVEKHSNICDRLVYLSQPLPDNPDFLLYHLLGGLTEAINTRFWLHEDLLWKSLRENP